MNHSDDVGQILKKDGVDIINLKAFENRTCVSIDEVKAKYGDSSWATRIVYNDRFGGVLIKQFPGEGNRLHYHSDADECWVILEGKWEWFIEGEGTKVVKKNDIVVVEKNTRHKITCIGNEPGIRFAITKPDVDHIYD
jgi:mannose-6-phosphate isomerase-like protein (cupin superfamily)